MVMIARKPAAGTETTTPAPQTATVAQPAQTVAQPAQAAQTQAVATVAEPAAGAVSTRVAKKLRDPIKLTFENKMKLEWNTLHRIMVTQGNFVDKENSNTAFGGEIVAQLMSYQASWQISPGTDNPGDAEHVRYSDDGQFTNKGEDCKEYLNALLTQGYPQAKMSERYQMALVIEQAVGGRHMEGKIVQIDLSQTSKNAFDQFRLEVGYAESRGTITPEAAESGLVKMIARVKSANGKGRSINWTQVAFELYHG